MRKNPSHGHQGASERVFWTKPRKLVGDKRPEVSPASAGKTIFSLIETLDPFFVDGRCGAIDSLQDMNWKRVRALTRGVVAAIGGKNPGHSYSSVALNGLQKYDIQICILLHHRSGAIGPRLPESRVRSLAASKNDEMVLRCDSGKADRRTSPFPLGGGLAERSVPARA
jgi:hypothetical protein